MGRRAKKLTVAVPVIKGRWDIDRVHRRQRSTKPRMPVPPPSTLKSESEA